MLIGIMLVLSGLFNVIVSFMRRDPEEEEEIDEESSVEYEDDDEMYGEEVGEDQVIERIKGGMKKEGYQGVMEFTQDEDM